MRKHTAAKLLLPLTLAAALDTAEAQSPTADYIFWTQRVNAAYARHPYGPPPNLPLPCFPPASYGWMPPPTVIYVPVPAPPPPPPTVVYVPVQPQAPPAEPPPEPEPKKLIVRYGGEICDNQLDDVAIQVLQYVFDLYWDLGGENDFYPYDLGNNRVGIRDHEGALRGTIDIGKYTESKRGSRITGPVFTGKLFDDIDELGILDGYDWRGSLDVTFVPYRCYPEKPPTVRKRPPKK